MVLKLYARIFYWCKMFEKCTDINKEIMSVAWHPTK